MTSLYDNDFAAWMATHHERIGEVLADRYSSVKVTTGKGEHYVATFTRRGGWSNLDVPPWMDSWRILWDLKNIHQGTPEVDSMNPTVEELFEHVIQIYDIPWELVSINSYYRTQVIYFSWSPAAGLRESKTLYLPLHWNVDQQKELTNKLSRYAETQRRFLIG